MDAKYREVSELPVGLEVVHTPNPVKARQKGPSGVAYSWVFRTTVRSLYYDVSITEFGAFVWYQGQWAFSTMTGKPFTADDFSDWYRCPKAKVLHGHSYSDLRNWGGGYELQPDRSIWYFIGVDEYGIRVKGEGVVEKLAELDE